MIAQTTNNIMLIRPANFRPNNETRQSNEFQKLLENYSEKEICDLAILEFDQFIKKLKEKNVNTLVIEDTSLPIKPDAIFPNNWVSFHANGTVVLYPMMAKNRRLERRQDIIESLKSDFEIKTILDFSKFENENKFLEGTGSIVFDHQNKIAYACLSQRTDKEVLSAVCESLNYTPFSFYSFSEAGKAIYHTNVMMCIAENFVIVCLDSISNEVEKNNLCNSFKETGHQIIDISFNQMNNFAGNMLEIKTNEQKSILALSQSAFEILTKEQKNTIEKHSELVPLSINTIETIGGGSARCMMAEIFLNPINNS